MKFNKLVSILLLPVIAFSVLSGCSKTETTSGTETTTSTEAATGTETTTTSEKKILRLNNNSEPGSLSPSMAEGTHDSWVIEHCFEGLYRKSKEGGVEPGVVQDVKVSDDGLTYTFTLKDTKWSNGEPLTAHDFEFTYKNVLNPETASKYAFYLFPIAGGEDYNSGKGSVDDVKVKAIDDKTLEFTLVAPMPYYQDYFSHYTTFPTNKKIVEETKAKGEDWSTKPETYICNGPFTLTEWKNKESIILTKNQEYFEKDLIKLDEVHFVIWEESATAWSAYQNDELDLVYPLPPTVVGDLVAKNFEDLTIAPDFTTYYYIFNTTKKPYNNLKVRQALSMSLEREILTTNIMKGGQKPAYGLTCPGVADLETPAGGDYQKNLGDLFSEDIAKAKTLLEEGLKEEGMTVADFKINLLYNTNELHQKVAEAAQNMWKKNLGVDVVLENQEFKVVIDRRYKQDFDVVRAGWQGDYVDPLTFIDLNVTGGDQNSGRYSNPEYDRLVKIAQTSGDQAERFKAMKEAERILIADMAIAPIMFYTKPYVKKPYLKDTFEVVNRYPQFRYADIVK